MPKKPLTVKQQRFVDFYDGNATDAARKAGYKGNALTLGQVGKENLEKPHIKKAIQARETKRSASNIADREERQQFWTESMRDGEIDIKDKLKASELLGRSEADFTDNVHHKGAGNLMTVVVAVVEGRQDKAVEGGKPLKLIENKK